MRKEAKIILGSIAVAGLLIGFQAVLGIFVVMVAFMVLGDD